MPSLAQIVENAQLNASSGQDTLKPSLNRNGSLSSGTPSHKEKRSRTQPGAASVPTSPLSMSPRSNSLAPPDPSSPGRGPGHEDTLLPDLHATEFVRTDSGFRRAWNYRDPDGEPPKKFKTRRTSWADSSVDGTHGDDGGLWHRWIEVPLGLAPDSNTERNDASVHDHEEGSQHPNGDLGLRTESPEPEGSQPDQPSSQQQSPNGAGPSRQSSATNWTALPKLLGLVRAKSMPHISPSRKDSRTEGNENAESPVTDDQGTAAGQRGWAVLRQRLRASSHLGQSPFSKKRRRSLLPEPSMAAEVDLNEELMAGPLAILLVRMYFERDDDGRRRVPVLLQHVKIRVSDSVHPLHNTHAVFRIECEYGDGAARWVVYRELRDFFSLHAHYGVANAYSGYRNRGIDLPDFPRTSIPLWNLLKKEGRGNVVGRAEFARHQREVLETYLIGLIKAVMFRPEANRLCRFLEVSALSIHLSTKGGVQGKAGILRVLSSNSSRKGPRAVNLAAWKSNHSNKWWLVRESYLVSVNDPSELQIDDVFLLDQDFAIERPKRYYRQGLNMLHIGDKNAKVEEGIEENRQDWDITKRGRKTEEKQIDHEHDHGEEQAETETLRSRSTISKFFSKSKKNKPQANGDTHDHIIHTTQADKGVREKAAELKKEGEDRASPERRTLGIYGNVSEADVKPVNPDDVAHRRTANAEGSNVAAVPDPHIHGERFFGRGDGTPQQSDDEDDHHPGNIIDPSIGQDPRQIKNPDDQGNSDKKKNKVSTDVSQHTFYIKNTQRRLKLVAKNERQMLQFIASMERMAAQSHWTGNNRFGSFAPIRLNVSAQWLADGRDYFWNLSRAIMLAKERIYIHDWWLSPELYLRRPNQEAYRLDKLLKRKAEQGVKVFVILYKEVSNRTTPTDSNYAKRRLMALHPNIMVQRSPGHFTTGTFYWAHHEKMCVIDETIAFMGGLDLCFGRWDTPQHVLIDHGEPGDNQIWPGKDYSNARVMDFHTLNKPMEDMYDRSKVARMPWHDVGVQIVGQPARDLCRHFVQRWNYLLRTKTHSRVMPFLLPPPDFKISDLTGQGLTGTCEIQICRSAGPWSLGTTSRIEHSIQNAYLKAIELSEHFVYIENQFFITSTVVNEIPVDNNIGDALVHRIIRAHREKTPWRAVVVIPLLPGFTFPIDHNDASSIRLIVELQNRSICRGPHSIFSRLRKEGIDPSDYITFFSLRGWGKLENSTLTTEQVYIHAKTMVVDDRLAIIGSANINERSMRGDRDSELACVIRDTDLIESRMAGKPYKAGRFAHSLRVRLMREHVGVDTDAMYEEDLMKYQAIEKPENVKAWDPDHEQVGGQTEGITKVKHRGALDRYEVNARDMIEQGLYGMEEVASKAVRKFTKHGGMHGNQLPVKELAHEKRTYGSDGSSQPGFASSKAPTLEEKVIAEHRPHGTEPADDKPLMDVIDEKGGEGEELEEARVADGTELFGAPADAAMSAANDDRPPNARPGQDEASEAEKAGAEARKQIRKHLAVKTGAKPFTLPVPKTKIDPHGFDDPLDPDFFKDVWMATAAHNTEIYRKVFHCTPDDLVTTWKQYKEYLQFQERLNRAAKEAPPNAPHVGRVPSEGGTAGEEAGGPPNTHPDGEMDSKQSAIPGPNGGQNRSKSPAPDGQAGSSSNGSGSARDEKHRRPSNFDEPLERWEVEEFESLLEEVQGNLVVFPTRFLEGEDTANNFLFNSDRLLPMPIFN